MVFSVTVMDTSTVVRPTVSVTISAMGVTGFLVRTAFLFTLLF